MGLQRCAAERGEQWGEQWGEGQPAEVDAAALRRGCQCALCVDEFTGNPLLKVSSVALFLSARAAECSCVFVCMCMLDMER